MGGKDADMMATMPPDAMGGMGPDMLAAISSNDGRYGPGYVATMHQMQGGMDADMMAAISSSNGRYEPEHDGSNAPDAMGGMSRR